MGGGKRGRVILDFAVFLVVMGGAVLLSLLLSGVNDDNNPFAMAVFLLAVVLVARATRGYLWGIAASLIGTFCVNYIFTYPFWTFSVSYPGYPLTVAVMLIVSVIVSTLTTRIKREEQLRFEADSEKMRANLLRAIAHDLRTPLASILGASSALTEQRLPEADRRALIAGIRQDAEWLVRVTENLLSVTRITAGEVSLKKEDEVLEEIIGSAVVKYRREARSLPVSVEMPDEILVVPMDGVLIEQVLINLFDNVSAHAAGADRIWLRISPGKGRVTISVEDNGCGIAEPRLPGVPDGLRQKALSERPDGRRSMGIGLSVCQSIIDAHGGTLRVGSSVYGGAAVSFELPCEEETSDEQHSE